MMQSTVPPKAFDAVKAGEIKKAISRLNGPQAGGFSFQNVTQFSPVGKPELYQAMQYFKNFSPKSLSQTKGVLFALTMMYLIKSFFSAYFNTTGRKSVNQEIGVHEADKVVNKYSYINNPGYKTRLAEELKVPYEIVSSAISAVGRMIGIQKLKDRVKDLWEKRRQSTKPFAATTSDQPSTSMQRSLSSQPSLSQNAGKRTYKKK